MTVADVSASQAVLTRGSVAERFREPARILLGDPGGWNRALLPEEHLPIGAQLLGTLPPLYPEWLGDRGFGAVHGVRFPYVAGEMANGIASVAMVSALVEAGMLGFFGAGGLGCDQVAQAIHTLASRHGQARSWGVNLIHSPDEPALERAVAELLVARRVPIVSCSAFMEVTAPVVLCSAAGLTRAGDGQVQRRTRIFAKVSRPEVAEQFMSPAPPELVRLLVAEGKLSAEAAELAASVPLATDVTVEADSGGHTDNRPLVVILPAIRALRDQLSVRFGYQEQIRIGAAGGIGTPAAVAAAFALGAAYVVTGSVNQLSMEADLSPEAKALLGEADFADVTMAPCADMFELGIRVQVLRRGTMFAGRAAQLYETYQTYAGLDEIPVRLREDLETGVFGLSLANVWEQTREYWQRRDPAQLILADRDPKHRMGLLFRWYLGQSTQWALKGEPSRRADYQIWCGPAVGAFNRWTRGSFLAEPGERSVVQIALNLLEGAAVLTRAQQLVNSGVHVSPSAADFRPRRLA